MMNARMDRYQQKCFHPRRASPYIAEGYFGMQAEQSSELRGHSTSMSATRLSVLALLLGTHGRQQSDALRAKMAQGKIWAGNGRHLNVLVAGDSAAGWRPKFCDCCLPCGFAIWVFRPPYIGAAHLQNETAPEKKLNFNMTRTMVWKNTKKDPKNDPKRDRQIQNPSQAA